MTMDVSKTETGKNGSTQQECHGCGKIIKERYLLKALEVYWHEDCLKCTCCDCRLGEVGSSLYTKADLILCKRDYLRLFGSTGHCAACNKSIPAFEMVMRARTNVYHLECFACQQCCHRFCVGDRFYLCDNKILCEYDYEERMIFASMQPTTLQAHLKRPNAQQSMHQMQHQQQTQQQPGQQHQNQQAQMLGQPMGQQNHVMNGQMPVQSTPTTVNGMVPTSRGGGPGDMNNNGLSGVGPAVKASPMPMQAPTS